jgi:hypothetical protein
MLEMNSPSIQELSSKLVEMNETLLYEAVQTIEKLNIKLMLEYNIEVSRGKNIGIIKNE